MEPVLMPKQGITVESCVITSWAKKPGDAVKLGDLLFSYETDKATFDVEAEVEGTLLAVFFEADEDIPVLTPVAVIGNPGDDFASLDPRSGNGEAPAQAAAPAPAPAPVAAPIAAPAPVTPVVEAAPAPAAPIAAPVQAAASAGNVGISPRAKALAGSLGLDASLASGTGPEGRIIERDVRTLMASGPVAAPAAAVAEQAVIPAAAAAPVLQSAAGMGEYEDKRLSGVRRAIAKGMTTSLTTMAQLTLSSSFDATAIMAQRKAFKNSTNPQIAGITLTDMVLFAVTRVLQTEEHAHFNAHLIDETMRYYKQVNLAFAVDTPRGLLVPTIYNAQNMSLRQMSVEAKNLASAAQSGNIAPDLLTGGTFTVSNLGGLGIEHFTPVINPPQTGILGLNNITWRPRGPQGDFYPAMGLSITFDHRAIDGAPAARLLQAIGKQLENVSELLAG